MKYFTLVLLILVFFGINTTSAKWYNNHSVSYSNPGSDTLTPFVGTTSGKGTWCDSDGDTAGGSHPTIGEIAVALNNSSNTLLPHGGNELMNRPEIGTINCLQWDSKEPEDIRVTYSAGWINSNVTITVKAKDRGGSKLKKIELLEQKNGVGGFYLEKTWDNLDTDTLVTRTWIKVVENNSNFRYKIIATDYAGNESYVTNFNSIMFDNVAPTLSDVGNMPNINLMANSSYFYRINVGQNGGSPIVSMNIGYEKFNNINSYYYTTLSSYATSTFQQNWNISKVDNDRESGGFRIYNFGILQICDQASNCGTINKDYFHNVYANPNLGTKEVNTDDKTALTDGNAIADGNKYPLNIHLKDIYGNEIIPASGISRNINFSFDTDNRLYLNEFDKVGNSVFVDIPSDINNFTNRFNLGDNITTDFNNQPSGNGIYKFDFELYNPTENTETETEGKFIINNITVTLSDENSINNIDNSNIDFIFKPLFQIDITGDLSPTGSGFVEGKVQTGSLLFIKNRTTIISDKKLYLVKTGSTESSFMGTGEIITPPSGKLSIITNLGNSFLSNFTDGSSYDLETIFTLIDPAGYIDDIKELRLYEYISYSIGGKNVVYLSNILNENNTNDFANLKIFGVTNIDKDKQRDLVLDQDIKSIQNLDGKITKATLKRDIKKTAIKIVKLIEPQDNHLKITNLEGTVWSDVYNGGKVLGNILYYKKTDGTNIILDNGNYGSSDIQKVTGKKTIVIIGGNLRISSNIVNSTNNDILGIIVLKDEEGRGGKVYIDTDVQKVDAIIFADKSIISYDTQYDNGDLDTITNHEIDGNVDNSMINNQLYFLGTIFSENTIGGSRLLPPVCPFWTELESVNCNLTSAQRYDLNYLRSGFRNKYDSTYGDYSVIIKYNPIIQTGPPPLFSR